MRFLQGSFFLFVLVLTSCSPSIKHQELIEQNLLSHQYNEADQVAEKNRGEYGSRNVVLYYLDRGMLLHLAGRYKDSNAFFEKADREIERLYTESLVTHVGALLSNDNLLPYQGEDFERVLITLFSALNYAALGEWDEALVEARRVDARLNLLNDRYTKKNVYKKDAFAHYLSGILYEVRGETNDAFIDYRKSHDAFKDYRKYYETPIPARLGSDLVRLAEDLHLEEESNTYRKLFPQSVSNLPRQRQKKKQGEVIVVAYAGRAPLKEDFFIDAPIPDGEGGVYVLTIAMPQFVPRPTRVTHVTAIFRQGEMRIKKRLDLWEDITAIAKKNLEDRVGRMTAKAIARATSKYIATRAARRTARKRKGDEIDYLVAFLGNVYAIVTEQSDKRSWLTLPGKIYLGRVSLSEGTWDANIRYLTRHEGEIETRHLPPLEIKDGEKRFLVVHTLH